jgi:hypothetical protein
MYSHSRFRFVWVFEQSSMRSLGSFRMSEIIIISISRSVVVVASMHAFDSLSL